MPKIVRDQTSLGEKLKKVTARLKEQRQEKKMEARKERLLKSKLKKKIKFKHPIDHLTPTALSNLEIINEDDTDTEDKSYYDATNGYPIDEEWHRWFCYACGYDREDEKGPCEACGKKYINFFK